MNDSPFTDESPERLSNLPKSTPDDDGAGLGPRQSDSEPEILTTCKAREMLEMAM